MATNVKMSGSEKQSEQKQTFPPKNARVNRKLKEASRFSGAKHQAYLIDDQ